MRTPYITLPAVAIAVMVALLVVARPAPTSADPALDAEEQAFITLINDYRAQNGRGPLAINPELQDAADWLSDDMGVIGYFSHTDSLGRSPSDRMDDFGYSYSTSKGENIAAGYTSAQLVFDGWRNSPAHDANMLSANYVVMGIARVYTPGSPYGWYWTNDFGGYDPPGPPQSTPSPTPPPSQTPAPTPTPSPVPTTMPSPTPSATPPPAPTATPTPTPPSTATPSPAPPPNDDDGDGFSNDLEAHVGTDPDAACGAVDTSAPTHPSLAWPGDLSTIAGAGRIEITDITSFLTPMRRLGTSPGDPNFDQRWDLYPGTGPFRNVINLLDLTTLIVLRPPMLDNQPAFNGPSICSEPPSDLIAASPPDSSRRHPRSRGPSGPLNRRFPYNAAHARTHPPQTPNGGPPPS